MPTDGVSSGAHGIELLDPRLAAFLHDLEHVALHHGAVLAKAGLIGTVSMSFERQGYRNMRVELFLRPSRKVPTPNALPPG